MTKPAKQEEQTTGKLHLPVVLFVDSFLSA
jgi:hypothetical protein